jgi:hypothetical protein
MCQLRRFKTRLTDFGTLGQVGRLPSSCVDRALRRWSGASVVSCTSSWLNMVERWFRDLTDKAIRRGVFHSVNDLITAIEDYLKANNDNPKPFVWTATAEQILAKVARGRVALQQVENQ